MKCPRCEYEWESKTLRPKECPRCKRRLDYQPGAVGAPKTWKKKEVRKEMTSKLPWATAATIIVIAAVGAWALWPTAEVPPVTPGAPATISVPTAGGIAFAGGIPTYSGIENIYIMQFYTDSYDNTDNMSGHENLQVYNGNTAVIEDTGQPAENIPYDNAFSIIVAVRGATENMYTVNVDNMYVRLVISNAFSDDENTFTENRFVFGESAGNWIRVNHIFDNGGNGYQLGAGENISLTVDYYCYK